MSDRAPQERIPQSLMVARLEAAESMREFFIQMWLQNPKLAQGTAPKVKMILAPLQRGFTLVELVVTIIILGIISAVVMPRFASLGTFDAAGYSDQVQALLRYANKTALAQRTMVLADYATPKLCVTSGTCSVASCTGADLPLPGGAWKAPVSTTTVIGGTQFCFDSMGRPYTAGTVPMAATVTLQVQDSGATIRSIHVEAETGYVH
jgi:MSHA pilin protein MshC